MTHCSLLFCNSHLAFDNNHHTGIDYQGIAVTDRTSPHTTEFRSHLHFEATRVDSAQSDGCEKASLRVPKEEEKVLRCRLDESLSLEQRYTESILSI